MITELFGVPETLCLMPVPFSPHPGSSIELSFSVLPLYCFHRTYFDYTPYNGCQLWGAVPVEPWGLSGRSQGLSCLTLDLCLTHWWSEPSPHSLSCGSRPGSCSAQAQGSAAGPHLAPAPRMRGALPGRGRTRAHLLLY